MILRDSINAPLIPRDSDAVAGYGDGRYIWSPSWLDGSNWWDLFPASTPRLVIVVSAAHSGDVLDVERGDATPAEVPGWLDRFSRPGRRRPTIYCDRSTIAAVRQAAAGRPFDWWAATLDGTTDVPGAVAVQFRDLGGWDESLVLDPEWIGGDPVTRSEKLAWVRVAYAAFGAGAWPAPPSSADQGFWADQILDDGSNVDGVLGAIQASDAATAYRALMAEVYQWAQAKSFPGLQGPPGPPADTSGLAKADHVHRVSMTGQSDPPA